MQKIQLIKPYISFEDVEEDFKEAFKSGMFTKGKNAEALRKELRVYMRAKHAFLTTSATTALWMCLKLLDIKQGDEVIVSDFSFPASSNVIEDLGAVPIFADVLKTTYNMCPDDLVRKITSKTRAVMFVDALGNPTGVTNIQDICRNKNIPMIEDAACALGSSENGVMCGSISDLSCFSFHPRKLMCTGEGGAITTSNNKWADWLNVKLNNGALGMKGMGLDFIDYGYNLRLSELPSIMGRKQIPLLNMIVTERQAMKDEYCADLMSLGFVPQLAGNNVIHNVQSVAFTVPDSVNRDGLINFLKDNNVETSIGTYSLSTMTYNQNKYDQVQPNSLYLQNNVIALPCYKDADITYVVEKIKDFVR